MTGKTGSTGALDPARHFDEVADTCAQAVLRSYSTSFGLACRLLGEDVRRDVVAIYALVRVADEVVDAPRRGTGPEERRRILDGLEHEVETALDSGQSANLVVHAFARAALRCGIDVELTRPFFASMRTDLGRRRHDDASLEQYVYGSAEVVGLMCLRAFLAAEPDPRAAYDRLAPGARRLGAAFQKVNFLRDLREDSIGLDRQYFPGVDPAAFSDRQRDELLDDIDEDLRVAAAAIRELPATSRRAVRLAHLLYAELARRLRATPAAELATQRVRVPAPVKARLAVRCLAGPAW